MARHIGTETQSTGAFSSVLKPLFVSLSFTFAVLCITALCIAYGPVSEKHADICILISTIISITLAGFLAARQKTGRGFIAGAIAGTSYVAVAYLVAALAFGAFKPGAGFIKLLVFGIFFGAVGGIIGINMKRKKH